MEGFLASITFDFMPATDSIVDSLMSYTDLQQILSLGFLLSLIKPRKTVLRVFRISKDLDEVLRKDAEKSRITVSGLVSAILFKYAEWDRFAERYGFVSLTSATLRYIVDELPEEAIRRLSVFTGDRFKDFALFWYKKADLPTLLATIEIITRHTKLAQYENDTDGNHYTLSFHHDFGRKWSVYISGIFERALRNLGVDPKSEVRETSTTISFSV